MRLRPHTLVHALLAISLLLQWLLLPASWRPWALPLTLLLFAAAIAALVLKPQGSFFVPTLCAGPSAHAQLALTFDDGPDPRWTPQILDVLRAHQTKATFFVVGARAAAQPELIARMLAEGHEIGCHTQHHRNTFHFQTANKMRAELTQAQATLTRLGAPAARYFRPPIGIRAPQLAWALEQLEPPMRCVTWSARGLDTFATTPARILARLQPAVRAGAILTLHDGTGFSSSDDRSATVAALPELLAHIRAQGLACVTVSDLFEQDTK